MSENKESIKRTLKRLDAMDDEAIDYSDVPPLSPEMFAQALVQAPRRRLSDADQCDSESV